MNTVKFSEKPGIVRVKNYKQGVAFVSDGKKGCKGKKWIYDFIGMVNLIRKIKF